MTPETSSKQVFASAPAFIVLAVVFIAVVIPRFMVLGGLPTTDEGIYAYNAMIIHASLTAGHGLPDTGGLALYPLLLNWIYSLKINPLVALRFMDMLVAAAAGYALYRVIEHEGKSRWGAVILTAIFLLTLNLPIFIQFGFKNSYQAAFLPLFIALWLGLTATTETSSKRWMTIGALLMFAVLLRETLIPFLLLGAIATFMAHGLKPSVKLAFGAVVAAIGILIPIVLARGGIATLIDAYRDAGTMYASIEGTVFNNFINNGGHALNEGMVATIIAAVGLLAAVTWLLKQGRPYDDLPKIGFWLSAALLPLIEPATKIGFPYHFSICLPGLAGLAALGLRKILAETQGMKFNVVGIALGIALLVLVFPRASYLTRNWPITSDVLGNLKLYQWPDKYANSSNYLLAARAIKEVTPFGGTVSISGFMLTLYPLTGYLPPKPELANLSQTIMKYGLSSERMRETLLKCPPDVLLATSRTDWPGGQELLKAIVGTNIYKPIYKIPTANNRHYGSFGGIIFSRTDSRPCELN